jgi:hypothetical protein
MIPETSVIFNELTRLIAQEDFIDVSCCESVTTYKVKVKLSLCFN